MLRGGSHSNQPRSPETGAGSRRSQNSTGNCRAANHTVETDGAAACASVKAPKEKFHAPLGS